ncbi:MAG: Acetylornithine deacetylase or succinyl-diaminopimelate desuccinylase [Desulfonauticus sp. 38_4375]|nr:MAG: Acetylornithine deacetylase or succinyl-diaminopimelate desuccinylase [Desulfonauticus sp. 38_4375]
MDKGILAYRNEVIYLQQELVQRTALGPENGGQGEEEKAYFLVDYLNKLGFNPQIYWATDTRVASGKRPNVVARYAGKSSKTLWILSHLDVVPPGDLSLWKSNPYEIVVDGDYIYGRGVEDNHQGIVSSLLVLKRLKELDITPDYSLGLLFVADEETGSKYGLQYLLNQDIFQSDDLFLVPDHGTPEGDSIEIAEKSMFWLKIIVEGKQCHASVPDKGVNSLVASADFILRLEELKNIFPLKNPLFDPARSTFSPTKKEANVENINTIPGKDIFYLDSRVLPEYKLEDVLEEIKKIGQEVEKKRNVNIKYEIVMQEQAAPITPEESEVVTCLKKAIFSVLKKKAKCIGVGGGTVAAFLRRKGFEAAVWSTLLGFAHQPNERSSITNTLNDARVMFKMLFK